MANGIPLVVMTERIRRQEVYTSLWLGAKAFVSLDGEPEDLLRAVRMASQNRVYMSADVAELVVSDMSQTGQADVKPGELAGACLSRREIEVVQLLCDGLSTKEVARRLHISFKTVENHWYNIYRKCSTDNIASLFRYALQNNVITVV